MLTNTPPPDMTIEPNAALATYSVLLSLAVIGAVVIVLKNRWAWLIAGVFLGGLLWLAAPVLTARPDSAWDRLMLFKQRRTAA
jgi:hypothetical protein